MNYRDQLVASGTPEAKAALNRIVSLAAELMVRVPDASVDACLDMAEWSERYVFGNLLTPPARGLLSTR